MNKEHSTGLSSYPTHLVFILFLFTLSAVLIMVVFSICFCSESILGIEGTRIWFFRTRVETVFAELFFTRSSGTELCLKLFPLNTDKHGQTIILRIFLHLTLPPAFSLLCWSAVMLNFSSTEVCVFLDAFCESRFVMLTLTNYFEHPRKLHYNFSQRDLNLWRKQTFDLSL